MEKRQRTAALQNLAEFPAIGSVEKPLEVVVNPLALAQIGYHDRQFQSHLKP